MNPVIPDAGLHHVALRTMDYDASLAFYTELLGMSVRAAWTAADGRRLALVDIGDGACIEIVGQLPDAVVPEGGQVHPFMHLAIRTSDPDVVWQRAIDAGWPSVLDPKDVVLGVQPARLAFFSGPSGEVIEMFRVG